MFKHPNEDSHESSTELELLLRKGHVAKIQIEDKLNLMVWYGFLTFKFKFSTFILEHLPVSCNLIPGNNFVKL